MSAVRRADDRQAPSLKARDHNIYNLFMNQAGSPQTGRWSRDTNRAAEDRQIEIWRALSTVQIAQVVNSASRAVRTLALAGIRSRYPAASSRELTIRLAAITLGRDLALRVYPELEQLEP